MVSSQYSLFGPVQEALFDVGAVASRKPPRDPLSGWRDRWAKAMAKADIVLGGAVDTDPEGVGGRWAGVLARIYPPPHAAKRIARAFEVKPETAKAWLSGGRPDVRSLCRLAGMHGVGVVLAVVAPQAPEAQREGISATLRDLDAAVTALRDQMTEARR